MKWKEHREGGDGQEDGGEKKQGGRQRGCGGTDFPDAGE